MTTDEIRDEVELLRKAFPGLNDDAVNDALREINYIETFPEDMIEERTSWDDLYSTVCTLQRGFGALYDVVLRMAGESPCIVDDTDKQNKETTK